MDGGGGTRKELQVSGIFDRVIRTGDTDLGNWDGGDWSGGISASAGCTTPAPIRLGSEGAMKVGGGLDSGIPSVASVNGKTCFAEHHHMT